MTAKHCYLEKVSQLSEAERNFLLTRIGTHSLKKQTQKLDLAELLAIQLETEDEMLLEWRQKMQSISSTVNHREASRY